MQKRRSFRRRLVLWLGATLALSLAAVCITLWLLAAVWTNQQLLVSLRAEAGHVAEEVANGRELEPERYRWNEPHHVFANERIDPFFLQVFDSAGRLVRASENSRQLEAPYPQILLDRRNVSMPSLLERPIRFSAGSDRLYGTVLPIKSDDGETIGFVQVARFDLGQESALQKLGVGLALGYLVVLGALLSLLAAAGNRVARPLETLTRRATDIPPDDLTRRIATPDDADLETVQLTSAINAALARIQRSVEEIRTFTSDAAHELQTPLAVLLGHIDVAMRRERSGEEYRTTLQTLRDEVDGMTRLVRALLGLARLDRERSALRSEPVDLSQMVGSEIARQAQLGHIEPGAIRTEFIPDAAVEGNEDLLRESIRNVIENAVKYADGKAIRAKTSRRNGNIVVTVEDGGPGIRPDEIERVRERFFRGSAAHDKPGYGLGLSLASSIVVHHGGRIDVGDSDLGGARFDILLPAA